MIALLLCIAFAVPATVLGVAVGWWLRGDQPETPAAPVYVLPRTSLARHPSIATGPRQGTRPNGWAACHGRSHLRLLGPEDRSGRPYDFETENEPEPA